jgi:hypothetical protein
MKRSSLPRAVGAAAAFAALALGAHAQTIGCEVGVANGGIFPTTGTGGGGTFPTTLPTVPTSFTLNVASLPPGATVVTEVKFFGLTHTWLSDVQWVLTDPSGASHNLWVRGPTGITSCDFNGDYSIVPQCVGLGLTPPATCSGAAILPPGAYDQFFGVGTTAWPSGTNSINNTPLDSIAAATGTWTLTAYDWASGDSGNLGSFDVCFGTPIAPTAPSAAPVLVSPLNGASFFSGPSVNLTWNAVGCATSYEVDVDGVVTSAVGSPFAYSSTPGLHTWSVRAVNASGAGPWATAFTFTDLGPPPPAFSPALLVGNDQSGTATIYAIDPSNGAALPIYASSTTDAKPWGMAYDASTNTVYWNNGATLFSSPYANPLVPTNLGGMTFNAATVNFVALSFANGKLYGTRNIATEAVYEIDPVTLVATQVYVHPSTYDFGGLEHDSVNGKLYGLTDAPSTSRGLYEIDIVGLTETFLAPYPAGETDIDALAVHNGLAYYVSDGPNTTQANFYVFDVATGLQVGTIPSPFTGSGTFSAATFVGASTGSPVVYCTAGTSTNGCVPAISGTAQPSVTFANACQIDVANIEGQKLGLIFYGVDNTGFAPNPWGTGTSFLCVKSPTQRTGTQNSGGNAGLCDGAFTLDWNAYQGANPGALGNPFSAGDKVYVQAWYRDPPAPKTTNLSDALEMTMLP